MDVHGWQPVQCFQPVCFIMLGNAAQAAQAWIVGRTRGVSGPAGGLIFKTAMRKGLGKGACLPSYSILKPHLARMAACR